MPDREKVSGDTDGRELVTAASDGSSESGVGQANAAAVPATPSPVPDQGMHAQGTQSQVDQVAAPGWRDLAANYGLDLSNFQSDAEAVRYLAHAYQQAQAQAPYAQYGQRYFQVANQFESWLAEQQKQSQGKPQQQPSWWNPPEFNPAWRQLVFQDPESREYKVVPGSPPDVLPKFLAYEQYRRDWVDRLTTDPVGTLQPMIQETAQQVAQGLIGQHLQTYQEQSYATNFVQQNSAWLHRRDQAGNLIRDFRGQPLLSPEGERFRDYVAKAESLGIRNGKAQEEYARSLLAADVMMAQAQGANTQKTNDQLKQNFLANNRIPAHSGSLSQANGNSGAQNTLLPLGERLRSAFAENGVNDSNLSLESR